MKKLIAKAALAAVVMLGAFGALSPASAGSLDVDIQLRPHHPRPVYRERVIVVKPAPRRIYVEPAPVVVVRPDRGRCTYALALAKASNSGIRRAVVSSSTPARVVVSGRFRGNPAKIVFANVRGCPSF